MCFTELKTKKARIEFIRGKLQTDDRWALKGLLTVFDNQTEDEQRSESVQEHNGIGFTGIDGEIMTSFAKRAISKGVRQALANKEPVSIDAIFTPSQAAIFRRKIGKYAVQLAREADAKTPLVKTPKVK